jgi:cell division protease FtsH
MKKANRNNGFSRNLLIWSVIVFFILFIYYLMGEMRFNSYKISFSEFLGQVESGQVKEVIIRGDFIEGKLSDGKRFGTLAPNYPSLIDKLENQKVHIEVAPIETSLGTFIGLLLSWFPVFLLIGLWFFFMRQMQGGSGKAMGFGKSKARLVSDKNNNITFADVAGIDEAKEELTEIVDFLKDPSKFQKLGGRIPKGCLLVGSPGTGKTLLAKAIAGEAKVPFFSISGSDFVEMFVGVGASRVRDMFEQAKKHAPCIIFIDEIDAVGRHRGAGLGGGNDEREQTLNQMLVEMDGFAPNEGIIVIAATNRPDVLDPALLRPGRFDRQIVVPIPDVAGRTKILTVHSAKVKLAPDVDLKTIARGTPGFSGADLANLVNEAALLAARRNRNVVTTQEMEDAKDKVMMGAERRSLVMKDEEKKLTAYHEGGHAIVSLHVPSSDPIHKATIIPRGRALGMVIRLPEDDRFSVTRERLKSDIAIAMGGRVAEELIFGYDKITSGASSDIKAATGLARKMVTQWGMSDEIGPVLVGDEREEVFLGHSLGQENRRSDGLAAKIDVEVKKLIEEGYALAKKILTKHADELHLLATNLLEFETLTGDEIRSLILDKKLDKKSERDPVDNTTLHSVPGMHAKPANETVEVKAKVATKKAVKKKPVKESTDNK